MMGNFNAKFSTGGDRLVASFGEIYRVETSDYEKLANKPSINGAILIGDKTLSDLGLSEITPQEIDRIIFGGD